MGTRDELVEIAKAMSDPSRVRILAALRNGELCLCHLIGLLELAPSTVSRHVDQLRQAGLVEIERRGKWRYFRLARREASPAARWALGWALDTLRDDPGAREDAERLARLRGLDVEEVTACYRG
jgi:DNA-binding transcriptional ArsR family regulator